VDNSRKVESKQARQPIVSLISKSEKAQQKLAPGTWQHTMLRDNLKALRIGLVLMTEETKDSERIPPNDLEEALHAFSKIIGKIESSQPKFSPGTSQHTLLQNRLKALRVAEALVKRRLITSQS
jgi:hypothetical protein